MFPGAVDGAERIVHVNRRGPGVLEGPPGVIPDDKESRQADVVAIAVRAVPRAGIELDGGPAKVCREGLRRDVVDETDQGMMLHRAGVEKCLGRSARRRRSVGRAEAHAAGVGRPIFRRRAVLWRPVDSTQRSQERVPNTGWKEAEIRACPRVA